MTGDEGHLSIAALAALTGVPATALRYYDELGLVRPVARPAGRRRYDQQAVTDIGELLLLRDAGFTLAEIAGLRTADRPSRRALLARRLDDMAQEQRRLDAARSALEHALECRAQNSSSCPRFRALTNSRLAGRPLTEAHAAAHAVAP